MAGAGVHLTRRVPRRGLAGLPGDRAALVGESGRRDRHGVASLFAAFDPATGGVIARLHRRHRHQEVLRFLKVIDANTPAEVDLHLVLDNYATYKTPAVQRWLAARPRFHPHFAPTSASWLNLVERWFAELTNRKLRRSSHRSLADLETDVRTWIEACNTDPRPFVWARTADEILNSLAAYCGRITAQNARSVFPRR